MLFDEEAKKTMAEVAEKIESAAESSTDQLIGMISINLVLIAAVLTTISVQLEQANANLISLVNVAMRKP